MQIKKIICILLVLIVSIAGTTSTVSKNEEVLAKKATTFVYVKKAAKTYKKPNKGKLKSTLKPGIYRQYSSSKKWSKVKNNKTKKYVWIKNAKSVEKMQSTKNKNLENDIVRLVNKERKKRHIAPLKADRQLNEMTMVRNKDMVENNYFSHSSPIYKRWANLLYTSEYKFDYAGENIAAGFMTAEDFVDGWMSSPSHRKNILNKRFTKIGVSVVKGSKKTKYDTYATQWFAK